MAYISGVGLTKFEIAAKSKRDYSEMGEEAAKAALKDAGVSYDKVDAVVVGYCYGDPTCGQAAVYNLGLTGVPVLNVNNNCSTGSTALYMARKLVLSGHDCVLALGMEKMGKNLSQVYHDAGWTSPTQKHFDHMYNLNGSYSVGTNKEKTRPYFNEFTDDVLKMFGYAFSEHNNRFGTNGTQAAKIAYKNHRHSINNPFAASNKEFTLEEIIKSPKLCGEITILQSCATGSGAAAALVCSQAFIERHNLKARAIEVVAQSLVTDLPSSLTGKSFISLSGVDLAQKAALDVYRQSGLTPNDVDVLEVHDCFSCAELFMYEALGLCEQGKGGDLIDSGVWKENKAGSSLCHIGSSFSKKNGWVVNPSGGLESKSHPIGATGLAQCYELVTQLRGEAGKRQVDDCKVALQHNFGVGSAAVVTMYRNSRGKVNHKNAPSVRSVHASLPTSPSRDDRVDWESAANVWGTLDREHSYWVPKSQITGKLPSDLVGTFFRNGPGNNEVYNVKLKHPIDGDGLICAVTFAGDRVHFKAKFVQSEHRLAELDAKQFLAPGQMGTKNTTMVSDLYHTVTALVNKTPFPHLKFRNPSNTNVFEWGGKVLTSFETHLPHLLDPTTLETIGLDSLNGEIKNLAAHFHIDPISNNLVVMSLKPGVKGKEPTITFLEFDIDWKLIRKDVFQVPGLNYAHDFAMTKDFFILHMSPFVDVSPEMGIQIAAGFISAGDSMKYYPSLPSRIVLLLRSSCNNHSFPKMFQCETKEPVHIFHFGTAHQTICEKSGNMNVEFTAVTLGHKFNMTFDHKVWLSNATDAPGRLTLFNIDIKNNSLSSTIVDRSSCEFPASHPYRHGLRCRYNYLMASDREGYNIPYRDIVKVDLLEKDGRQVWNSNGFVGEPVYVPKIPMFSREALESDEDEGYVLVQVFQPKSKTTAFVVLDAKHVDKGPIASINLSHSIPAGFHGTFSPNVFNYYPSKL